MKIYRLNLKKDPIKQERNKIKVRARQKKYRENFKAAIEKAGKAFLEKAGMGTRNVP